MIEPKDAAVPAGKSAEQLAFEAEMDALNAELLAAKTPAQQQVVVEKQKQAIVKAKKKGVTKSGNLNSAMAEITAFTAALAAATTAPQEQAIIQSEAKAMIEPKGEIIATKSAEQIQFEQEMEKLNAAMLSAKTPAQKKAIIASEVDTIVKAKKSGITKSDKGLAKAMADIAAFNAALAAASSVQQQENVIKSEAASMLAPQKVVYDETSEEMARFEQKMDTLYDALLAARTPAEQKLVVQQQAQTILDAKKKGLTKSGDVSTAQYEVNEFKRKLAEATTPQQQQATIQVEALGMLHPDTEKTILVEQKPAQQELLIRMEDLTSEMKAAKTPAQQQAVVEKQKKAIKKAKKEGATKSGYLSDLEAEVQAFNEALKDKTPQQQQVIIQDETNRMLTPKTVSTAGMTEEQLQLHQKMESLNEKMQKATSLAEQKQIAKEQEMAVIESKQKGLTKSGNSDDAAKEIQEFKEALNRANSDPQKQAIIQTEARAMTQPRATYYDYNGMAGEKMALKDQMQALVAAMVSAKTPQQQQAVAAQQKAALDKAKAQGLTKSGFPADAKAETKLLTDLLAGKSPQIQQAILMNETKQMLEPTTLGEVVIPVSPQMAEFSARMEKLDKAMQTAKTPAQKKAIIDSEAKSIVKAKKEGITRADRQIAQADRDVQEFLAKLDEALTMQAKEAVIHAEAETLLTPVAVAEESTFDRDMDALNTALARAKSPAQQFAILEEAKQTLVKEKRAKKGLPQTYDAAYDNIYAEIARFNAALLAAESAQEKQALIEAEKATLLKPRYQAPVADDRWTAFETEMSSLNSALASAKTRKEQNQLLEEQQQAVIRAKQRGLRKADESEAQMVAEIAAFNSALLAAETAKQQQELIDIERRALLKAQKAIRVKNAEQEVFEAEMTGYDAAYASAQSDLEKLTILEAQKQAIVKAKKKGVVKAQKAAKEGRKLNDQQVRLDILEAELVALKAALARAESEAEKRAVIDAEKNALIEVKKQVARTEGVLAEGEVDLAKVRIEPMEPAKPNKRAERKAKRLAKKQAEEDEAPIPHNKRGKISEKTLDSGTVK